MPTTPDLPVELWLQILSYLPRSALHKMIGINRLLFDLALDDIYEEIRFVSNDTEMRRSFQQLKFATIAKRVKQLLIRPTFLPALDLDRVEEDTFSSGMPSILSRLNCFKSSNFDLEQSVEARNAEATEEVLRSAKEVLKLCPNIQELRVVLHDHRLTPLFVSFLNSLWNEDSIGPRLRKLRMDMTLSNILIFLKPLINSPTLLRNLETFSIDFAPSRFDVVPNRHDQTTNNSHLALTSLRSFLSSSKDTLIDISISAYNAHDFTAFLNPFPQFPKLKKVELLTIFHVTAHQTTPLFQFLSAHSNQLEELTIKPYPRQTSFSHSDQSYAIWINDRGTNGLGNLTFPRLKAFDFGLREHSIYVRPPSTTINVKRLPKLRLIAPNLRRLVMTDAALSLEHIGYLVDGLSELESIEFVAEFLSPQTFDLFADKMPQLKTLAVDFLALSDVRGKGEHYNLGSRFVEAIRARRYPNWKLKHLRLSVMQSCGQPHPRVSLMEQVAEAFPLGVEVDTTYRCCCDVAAT